MKVWVYILQSDSSGRFYCGQTGNVEKRLQQHNDLMYKGTLTTKRFEGRWKLIWSCECPARASALRLERTIKQRGIGRYLKEGHQSNASGGC